MNRSPLTGKIALVTGASRGIGRAIAERLAGDGATVAEHFARGKDAAEETIRTIKKSEGKAFPDVLTLNLAQLLGPRGITTNAVAPGSVATDMNPPLKTEEGRNLVVRQTALGRFAVAKDIADVVAFLASEGSRWVTRAND